MSDDPFFRERRLEHVVDELESIIDDYEFDAMDVHKLEEAQLDIESVRYK